MVKEKSFTISVLKASAFVVATCLLYKHAVAEDITGFNPNYLLIGNDSIGTNRQGGLDCDIKFQLSFSRRLRAPTAAGAFFTQKVPLYFGFTQEAYWDICGDSAPFRETNYSPTLFYRLGKEQDLLIGFMHESNGRDGDESRSWDRIYARWRYPFGLRQNTTINTIDQTRWVLDLTAWAPFNSGSNTQGIEDFAGYGEISLSYNPTENTRARLKLRKGGWFDGFDKYLTELDVILPIPGLEIKLMIQYTNGFGASLERYNQRETALRIGVIFSDFNASKK